MVVDMLARTEKARECRSFNYPDHSCHVETVVCMINQNAQAKQFIDIGIDEEEYYRIKDSEKN